MTRLAALARDQIIASARAMHDLQALYATQTLDRETEATLRQCGTLVR